MTRGDKQCFPVELIIRKRNNTSAKLYFKLAVHVQLKACGGWWH